MHILLVEDNEHDIFFVREALKRIEHRIELSVVTDGAQALDFLSRRAPYTQAVLPTIILWWCSRSGGKGSQAIASVEL